MVASATTSIANINDAPTGSVTSAAIAAIKRADKEARNKELILSYATYAALALAGYAELTAGELIDSNLLQQLGMVIRNYRSSALGMNRFARQRRGKQELRRRKMRMR